MLPRSKSILCADHDPDTCELIAFLLDLEGYEIKIATRASDAQRIAQNGRFDLYLLDDFFEDGSGLELLASIRAFDQETPIIIYSADARESARRQALENGAQSFLTKPSDIDLLLNTIRRFIEIDRSDTVRVRFVKELSTQQ